MERLTKEAVRDFIENRYPDSKIIAIEMIDKRETMAFVLAYRNVSVVERFIVDINSDGQMDLWSRDAGSFTEIYRRAEI